MRHAVVLRGSSYKTSGGILDHLEYVQQLTTDTSQKTVTIVQSAADKSVYKFHCGFQRQRLFNRSQLTQLEETGPNECSYMIIHGELTVELNTKVIHNV